MKNLFETLLIVSLITASASAQSNKIVFGPLEGDDAGVLTVRNGEAIEIEVWVRTDPSNPAPIVALAIGLLSKDSIIAERNCAVFNPYYDWEYMGCDGPFRHDPDDPFPIPEGHTLEFIWAYCSIFYPEGCDTLDTGGEWDYFASFLMVCNTGVPADEIYYPFSSGWYPHSGQGTAWSFEAPPGGSVVPEQSFCELHFVPECNYIRYDCNHNGVPWELSDIVAMIAYYRGVAEPGYTCHCPPHGDNYPPGADPDGNCVPYELSDLVVMLGPPPDWPPYGGGCPDCPDSEGLVIRENEDQ